MHTSKTSQNVGGGEQFCMYIAFETKTKVGPTLQILDFFSSHWIMLMQPIIHVVLLM